MMIEKYPFTQRLLWAGASTLALSCSSKTEHRISLTRNHPERQHQKPLQRGGSCQEGGSLGFGSGQDEGRNVGVAILHLSLGGGARRFRHARLPAQAEALKYHYLNRIEWNGKEKNRTE